MQTARTPPADPTSATIVAVLAMHTGHMYPSLDEFPRACVTLFRRAVDQHLAVNFFGLLRVTVSFATGNLLSSLTTVSVQEKIRACPGEPEKFLGFTCPTNYDGNERENGTAYVRRGFASWPLPKAEDSRT